MFKPILSLRRHLGLWVAFCRPASLGSHAGWQIPDATALELIEFSGKLGASGKRPRFRFTTRQRRITSYLPELDTALAAAGKDQAWLHRKIHGAPFSRRTPVEHMVAHGVKGMADVLQLLNRAAMRAALTKRGR
jgi:hypothetical protein